MKKHVKRILILISIIVVMFVTYTLSAEWIIKKCISHDKISLAVNVYNYQLCRCFISDEIDVVFSEKIGAISDDFFLDDDINEENFENDYKNKYQKIHDKLNKMIQLKDEAVSSNAQELLELINIEYNGRIQHMEAENAYESENYIEAMKIVSELSDEYSQIVSVKDLYNDSVSEILKEMAIPNSVDEYEIFIDTLSGYIEIVNDEMLCSRKKELEDELIIYREVVEYINTAEEYVDKKNYVEAVKVLNEPIQKYPNEKHLMLALEDCQSYLVISTVEQVKTLADKKEYKEALGLIDEARNVYACEDLDILYDEVKSLSSPLYRLSNTVKNTFSTLAFYFKKEIVNVENEGGMSYVMRSGEKILLGDYSKEEVSLLSCAGSGILALAGLDAMLDVRDFIYDIQHIGEDGWVIRMLDDTLAIIPAVGAVKYLKYLKKTGNEVVDTAKVADDMSDILKSADNASDVVKVTDATQTVMKCKNELADVKLGKLADAGQEVKHYKHVATRNQSLKGKKNKEGINFESRKLEYSDGRRIEGVFPVFEYKFQCKLPDDKLQASDTVQFRECTKQLQQQIKNNPKIIQGLDENQLEQIKAGSAKISGFTWHHNEEEGVMQLIDEQIHKKTAHTGGKELWGGGSSAR